MMCFQCQKKVAELGHSCPMCRAHFDKKFVPQIDKDLQLEIAEAMGKQFEERKMSLEQAGEWFNSRRLIKFSFGNTYEYVKDGKIIDKKEDIRQCHRWAMFASLSTGVEDTSKFIKSVTYHLHPTFRQPVIKVTKAPFLLSRIGWGYFEIKMVIEF